ncbi:hypothetical protein ACQP2E_19015 [Actinoplanes sp. CA-015351]|uniref:hypothetical protein n=1 Tax=Actinoplanes sp. CA-015351 TaxID=3239897 RepID=UPI003D9A08E3
MDIRDSRRPGRYRGANAFVSYSSESLYVQVEVGQDFVSKGCQIWIPITEQEYLNWWNVTRAERALYN